MPHPRACALAAIAAALLGGCAPCSFDNGIVRGQVLGLDGLPLAAGRVQFVPTSGEARDAAISGDGFYEASLPAGSWEVIGWDADDACFSPIATLDLAACDERVVDLALSDCFR